MSPFYLVFKFFLGAGGGLVLASWFLLSFAKLSNETRDYVISFGLGAGLISTGIGIFGMAVLEGF